MSRKSAYRLRRRKGAESFAAAWDSIIAARPRGTSSAALVWRRLVKEAGGRSAVRIEDSTAAESEALRRAAARAAGRPAPRKVTMKSRRAFHELQAGRAMRPRPRKVTEATQIPVSGVDLVTFKKGEGPLVLLKGHTIFAAKE